MENIGACLTTVSANFQWICIYFLWFWRRFRVAKQISLFSCIIFVFCMELHSISGWVVQNFMNTYEKISSTVFYLIKIYQNYLQMSPLQEHTHFSAQVLRKCGLIWTIIFQIARFWHTFWLCCTNLSRKLWNIPLIPKILVVKSNWAQNFWKLNPIGCKILNKNHLKM